MTAVILWTHRRPWRALAAGGALLFTISFVLVHLGPLARGQISDTWVYKNAGDAIVHHGQMPYRDFELEYPPGALPVFIVPSIGEPFDYQRSFQIEMFACGLAIVLAVVVALQATGATGRESALAMLLVGLSPLLIGPLLLSRFDLWPAALTVTAIAALAQRRARPAAVVLGVAFATKLYAVALLPLAVIDVWRRRGAAAAARFCAASIAVATVIFLPFAAVSRSGTALSFTRQIHRPLQVESLGSAILIAVHQLTGMHIRSYGFMGSDNLASPGAGAMAAGLAVVGLLALAGVYAAYALGEGSRKRLCVAAAAAVSCSVAFNKVLSPQYMIWLAPLVPLAVTARRGRLALALLAVAFALTQSWYPRHYVALADHFRQPETWLLLGRDLLLVALAGVLVSALLPRRRAVAVRVDPSAGPV